MEINTPEHRLRMAPWWGMVLYLAVGAVWVALSDALLAALISLRLRSHCVLGATVGT